MALREPARAWFEALRDRLCAAFEAIEDAAATSRPRAAGPPAGRRARRHRLTGRPAGRFDRTTWLRPTPDDTDGGGGVISLMRGGRVFEKVGVNVSTVWGEFSPEFRAQIPGAAEDPRFWASGISLVAHMQSPRVPAAHFNTRMLITTKGWFGGGGDLTPMRLDTPEALDDAADFHAAFQAACDRHDPVYYRGVQGVVRPLLLPAAPRRAARRRRHLLRPPRHRRRRRRLRVRAGRGRGVPRRVPAHRAPPHGRAMDRRPSARFQLVRRGRYVEFNLIHDRGTLFGLKTGGNVEAILMSLPPMVAWP